ncbi:hypothetical protein FRUB_01714 [Fimbriiglobus ruber]|uniref:Uncharacterized protein n=1 Tax=Fimbriiglobus ruber TaxID=1908690 RepID=A0A225DWF8_9BACT|nr:hypothetical protein FRUB_01714 [Fimbriiglobus ruber]
MCFSRCQRSCSETYGNGRPAARLRRERWGIEGDRRECGEIAGRSVDVGDVRPGPTPGERHLRPKCRRSHQRSGAFVTTRISSFR